MATTLQSNPKFSPNLNFVVQIVILLVIIHSSLFAVFSLPDDIIDKPLGEDAFYMFSIARNVAQGDGIVYNYDIQTNGVQPLVMIPYTIVYFITESLVLGNIVPLRIILLINVLFWLTSAYLSRNIVRLYGERINLPKTSIMLAENMVLLLFIANVNVMRIYLYGLETGLYLTLFLFMIFWLVQYRQLSDIPDKYVWGLGLISGFTILARIDFIILLFGFLGLSFIFDRSSFRKCVMIGIVALIVASPWFIYNYIGFGSFMPSSGTAQSQSDLVFSTVHFTVAIQTVLDQILAIFWLPRGQFGTFEVFVLAGKIVLAMVGLVLLRRELSSTVRWPFSFLLIAYFALVSSYILLISATHFYQRYFSPGLVVYLLILAIALGQYFDKQKISPLLSVFFAFSLFCIYVVFTGYTLHRGAISNSHVYSSNWLQEEIENDVRVGAFQSGLIGYFHENVFNLDGKVNPDALEYLRDGNIACYIQEQQIEYVVDWPGYIRGSFSPEFLSSFTEQVAQIEGSNSLVLKINLQNEYDRCEL